MAFSLTRFRYHTAPATASGCKVWQKYTEPKTGYGRVRIDKRNAYAHVVAWEQEHGPVPLGRHLIASCSTRSCIAPEHWCLSPVRGTPRRTGPTAGTPEAVLVEVVQYARYDPDTLLNTIPAWQAAGHTNLAIADELGVSEGFVQHYLQRAARL